MERAIALCATPIVVAPSTFLPVRGLIPHRWAHGGSSRLTGCASSLKVPSLPRLFTVVGYNAWPQAARLAQQPLVWLGILPTVAAFRRWPFTLPGMGEFLSCLFRVLLLKLFNKILGRCPPPPPLFCFLTVSIFSRSQSRVEGFVCFGPGPFSPYFALRLVWHLYRPFFFFGCQKKVCAFISFQFPPPFHPPGVARVDWIEDFDAPVLYPP